MLLFMAHCLHIDGVENIIIKTVTSSIQSSRLNAVFKVKRVFAVTDTRFGIRYRRRTETVLMITVVEIVSVLKRTRYGRSWIYKEHLNQH